MVALKQSSCWTDLLPELLSSKFLYVVEKSLLLSLLKLVVIWVVKFWTSKKPEKMLFEWDSNIIHPHKIVLNTVPVLAWFLLMFRNIKIIMFIHDKIFKVSHFFLYSNNIDFAVLHVDTVFRKKISAELQVFLLQESPKSLHMFWEDFHQASEFILLYYY